jgi:hypothetical protein
MNFDDYKFRCSALGKLMTNDRSGKAIGETAIKYLVECYVERVYGRKKDISNKYIEKGLSVEEDAITLYSRLTKKFFKKNDQRVNNAFVSGEPDLFEGESIMDAEQIIDTKSSWDIFTFFFSKTEKVDKGYFWQMQGYMDITGAKKATLAYCLINTPDVMIEDEKRRLLWKMGAVTDQNDDYLKAAEEVEKSMRFDDIPMKERLILITVDRDDAAIKQIHDRVIEGRGILNGFLTKYHNGVLPENNKEQIQREVAGVQR